MKVGIGLSGGIDSSLAAWRLLHDGHDVVGYTMAVVPGKTVGDDAARAADFLHIPLRLLDFSETFEKQVLEPFVEEYASGLTPSPCVWCNAKLKFGLLAEAMLADGCDAVATGHYARLKTDESNPLRTRLFHGIDPVKDQSYFLAQVDQRQFRHVVFPLGNMLKDDVRKLAVQLGLPAAEKKESQDLCFLNDETFSQFILRRRPEMNAPGWIVTEDGRRLGRHDGAFRYTIGQRRGLGLGGGPWFVSRIDMADNLVIVAHGGEAAVSGCRLSKMNYFVEDGRIARPIEGDAQIRYRMKPRKATVVPCDGAMAELQFDSPVESVTPGQLAVLYDRDEVIASGWIEPFE